MGVLVDRVLLAVLPVLEELQAGAGVVDLVEVHVERLGEVEAAQDQRAADQQQHASASKRTAGRPSPSPATRSGRGGCAARRCARRCAARSWARRAAPARRSVMPASRSSGRPSAAAQAMPGAPGSPTVRAPSGTGRPGRRPPPPRPRPARTGRARACAAGPRRRSANTPGLEHDREQHEREVARPEQVPERQPLDVRGRVERASSGCRGG